MDDYNRISHGIVNDIKKEFIHFIQTHADHKYEDISKALYDQGKHLLIINHQDFIAFNAELANTVFDEFYRY